VLNSREEAAQPGDGRAGAAAARLPCLAAVKAALLASIAGAVVEDFPFRHFLLRDLLPSPILSALRALPFKPIELGGISGRRELHNDQRQYFDRNCQAQQPACGLTARAFQSSAVVRALASTTGASLAATSLRVEYARDGDGFWLEPHTDLGVKALTIFAPLPGPRQAGLGATSIQAGRNGRCVCRSGEALPSPSCRPTTLGTASRRARSPASAAR
jgi:hypothetical protein